MNRKHKFPRPEFKCYEYFQQSLPQHIWTAANTTFRNVLSPQQLEYAQLLLSSA